MSVADLNEMIRAAWQRCRNDYNKCWLNSERGLQAAFGFHLRRIIEDEELEYLVFIEPRVKLEDGTTVRPDILICEGENVVVAIEVKYQPKKRASIIKDLGTLVTLFKQCETLKFDHCRYLGPCTRIKEFRFSNDLELVWAGVHRKSKGVPQGLKDAAQRFGKRFMHLHIETQKDSDAVIPDMDAE